MTSPAPLREDQRSYRLPDPSPPARSTAITRIEPAAGRVRLGLGELWEYRDLVYFLAWRDVKVRYKQTVIGAAWVILQPFLTMVVISVLVGRMVKVPSANVPYPLFAFSALVPWSYFTHALTKSITSMVTDNSLVTQVYVPRLILPIAASLGGLADFVVTFAALLLLMAYYGTAPGLMILTIPLFGMLTVATAIAVGLWLAPLNAQYRDVANAIPFLLQLGLLVTPVAYPSSVVPESLRMLYGLNPMAGAIEGFRWAIIGGSTPAPTFLLSVSACTLAFLLLAGVIFFQRREETLADVI